MSILHKYQQHDFENGFQTHNSILDEVPYEPEVIIIGTFNHGWSWNNSDFYYGRGMYMWTAMANLFLYNSNLLTLQRTAQNNIPSKTQIFDICSSGKIVFADIVKGIKDNIDIIELPENESVLVNNQYMWSSYKDGPLDYMATQGWLDNNVNAIVKYINETKSIKHIYFTFKTGSWLIDKLNEICIKIRPGIMHCSIFTPTANGFGKQLQEPFQERVWGLTHCWIWNGLNHKNIINRPHYGHLNHEWLIRNGVDPRNF
jgi:hypothetical protein